MVPTALEEHPRSGGPRELLLWLAPAVRGAGPDVSIDLRVCNFERPEEVQKLYNLLKRAAESACSDSQITGSHTRTISWLNCIAGALDMAVEAVDRPALTAYHRAYGVRSEDLSSVAAPPPSD
mgnify:CR=1 FL=1